MRYLKKLYPLKVLSVVLTCCFVLATVVSCEKFIIEEQESILSERKVNVDIFSYLPVDISDYNLLQSTKSGGATGEFIVDSLLKWEYEDQLYLEKEQVLLRQIPIDFKRGKIHCSVTHSVNRQNALDSLTQVKSYYIIVENFSTNEKIEYLASMFPLYSGTLINDNCTFLRKANYSGVIIYSTLDGEFLRVEHFQKGRLLKGKILSVDEIKDNNDVIYLAVYSSPQTKAGGADDGGDGDDDNSLDGGELNPIIVTPTTPTGPKDGPSMEEEESGGGGPTGSDLYKDQNGGGGGGGGSSSGENYNSGQTYTVSATVSMLSDGFGTVTGGGVYAAGSSASIVASPVWEYQFYNWSGDFAGKPSSFSFQVEKDVSAEANFRIIDLCIDAINNKSNPLRVMKLAPPKGSMIAAATYGPTRVGTDGNIRVHNGIDLFTPLGTPIFSMFTGSVERVVSSQENKVFGDLDASGDSTWVYPEGYSGDKNGAGNRIYVNSVIGGDNIRIGYWHLQGHGVDNGPIAINPRTGVQFKAGDKVYQGEVIGYAGYTGNASKSVPHLHLNLSKNNVATNPIEYLNAIITTTDVNITLLNCINK